ncbi:MAG: 3-demethoxyubiquinol 3-hydroxylase, partial [Gammaproteobacteria bacterium]
MEGRKYSFLDSVLINFDKGIRTVFSVQDSSGAPVPGSDLHELDSSKEHRLRSEGLMRVNHAGEVAAQALYHGQSLAACDPAVRETMAKSASEENDHLYWCEERLRELGGRTSLLNPFWYFGSFMI